MYKLLSTAAISMFMVLNQPSFAHFHNKGSGHQPPREATKAMLSQELLTNVKNGMNVIGSKINAEKFETIHSDIEKISLAANSIKSGATLEEAKKERLESSVNQFVAQLAKLHTVTDAKDAHRSNVEFKKAQSALKLVESNLQ